MPPFYDVDLTHFGGISANALTTRTIGNNEDPTKYAGGLNLVAGPDQPLNVLANQDLLISVTGQQVMQAASMGVTAAGELHLYGQQVALMSGSSGFSVSSNLINLGNVNTTAFSLVGQSLSYMDPVNALIMDAGGLNYNAGTVQVDAAGNVVLGATASQNVTIGSAATVINLGQAQQTAFSLSGASLSYTDSFNSWVANASGFNLNNALVVGSESALLDSAAVQLGTSMAQAVSIGNAEAIVSIGATQLNVAAGQGLAYSDAVNSLSMNALGLNYNSILSVAINRSTRHEPGAAVVVGSANGQWVQYQSPTPILLQTYAFTQMRECMVMAWQVLASQDGNNWYKLDDHPVENNDNFNATYGPNQWQLVPLGPYVFFRFVFQVANATAVAGNYGYLHIGSQFNINDISISMDPNDTPEITASANLNHGELYAENMYDDAQAGVYVGSNATSIVQNEMTDVSWVDTQYNLVNVDSIVMGATASASVHAGASLLELKAVDGAWLDAANPINIGTTACTSVISMGSANVAAMALTSSAGGNLRLDNVNGASLNSNLKLTLGNATPLICIGSTASTGLIQLGASQVNVSAGQGLQYADDTNHLSLGSSGVIINDILSIVVGASQPSYNPDDFNNEEPGEWIQYQSPEPMVLQNYQFVSGNGVFTWVVVASNDAVRWFRLDVHTGDTFSDQYTLFQPESYVYYRFIFESVDFSSVYNNNFQIPLGASFQMNGQDFAIDASNAQMTATQSMSNGNLNVFNCYNLYYDEASGETGDGSYTGGTVTSNVALSNNPIGSSGASAFGVANVSNITLTAATSLLLDAASVALGSTSSIVSIGATQVNITAGQGLLYVDDVNRLSLGASGVNINGVVSIAAGASQPSYNPDDFHNEEPGEWIQYQSPEPMVLQNYQFGSGNVVSSWVVLASNDAVRWVRLDIHTGDAFSDLFSLSQPESYVYYRFIFESVDFNSVYSNQNRILLGESFQMNGQDYAIAQMTASQSMDNGNLMVDGCYNLNYNEEFGETGDGSYNGSTVTSNVALPNNSILASSFSAYAVANVKTIAMSASESASMDAPSVAVGGSASQIAVGSNASVIAVTASSYAYSDSVNQLVMNSNGFQYINATQNNVVCDNSGNLTLGATGTQSARVVAQTIAVGSQDTSELSLGASRIMIAAPAGLNYTDSTNQLSLGASGVNINGVLSIAAGASQVSYNPDDFNNWSEGEWIQYQSPEPMVLQNYQFVSGNGVSIWSVVASNDAVRWFRLDIHIADTFSSLYTLSQPESYVYFRFIFQGVDYNWVSQNQNRILLGESFQMNGQDYATTQMTASQSMDNGNLMVDGCYNLSYDAELDENGDGSYTGSTVTTNIGLSNNPTLTSSSSSYAVANVKTIAMSASDSASLDAAVVELGTHAATMLSLGSTSCAMVMNASDLSYSDANNRLSVNAQGLSFTSSPVGPNLLIDLSSNMSLLGNDTGALVIDHFMNLSLGANSAQAITIGSTACDVSLVANTLSLAGANLSYDGITLGLGQVLAQTINIGAAQTQNINMGATGNNLNVNCDLRVNGKIFVSGEIYEVNMQNLLVKNKVINLNNCDENPAACTDLSADGAGLQVEGSTPHSFLWNKDDVNGNNWAPSDSNMNVQAANMYQVDKVEALSKYKVCAATAGDAQGGFYMNGPVASTGDWRLKQDPTTKVLLFQKYNGTAWVNKFRMQ